MDPPANQLATGTARRCTRIALSLTPAPATRVTRYLQSAMYVIGLYREYRLTCEWDIKLEMGDKTRVEGEPGKENLESFVGSYEGFIENF